MKSDNGKSKYSMPKLVELGRLSANTLSGAGTMVEATSMMVTCAGGTAGGMAMKYPCA